jgi:hypothetical protein
MTPDLASARLSYEQPLELVSQPLAENGGSAQRLNRSSGKESRSAGLFSKNKRKKNPKRPGRKPGLEPFNDRPDRQKVSIS